MKPNVLVDNEKISVVGEVFLGTSDHDLVSHLVRGSAKHGTSDAYVRLMWHEVLRRLSTRACVRHIGDMPPMNLEDESEKPGNVVGDPAKTYDEGL